MCSARSSPTPSSTWRRPGGSSPTRPPAAGSSPATSGCHVEHALASGVVYTTPGRDRRRRCGCPGEDPAGPPDGYTSGWPRRPAPGPAGSAPSTRRWTATTRPGPPTTTWPSWPSARTSQGQGIGTALLRAHHASLDRDGMPAYLEASDLRTRRLYLAYGYADDARSSCLTGPHVPMVRQPRGGAEVITRGGPERMPMTGKPPPAGQQGLPATCRSRRGQAGRDGRRSGSAVRSCAGSRRSPSSSPRRRTPSSAKRAASSSRTRSARPAATRPGPADGAPARRPTCEQEQAR